MSGRLFFDSREHTPAGQVKPHLSFNASSFTNGRGRSFAQLLVVFLGVQPPCTFILLYFLRETSKVLLRFPGNFRDARGAGGAFYPHGMAHFCKGGSGKVQILIDVFQVMGTLRRQGECMMSFRGNQFLVQLRAQAGP
jgi:hypothetical protein